jgi:CubicO group peptidase (beta-lactamase class C family)
VFRNASMTKAVATTAALQLVEQGRLSLDATVESILPEFGELSVLDGFDGDKPRLRPPASKATVRQLMTHSAGLGYFFLNEKLLKYHTVTGEPNALSGLKRSLSVPMVNDPGTAWEYGVNTDWLGLIVEKLSGQSLGSYLQQFVYGPLGMKDSTFAPSAEQRERLLPVKQRQADGTLAPSPYDLPPSSEWDAAGHGSYGTVQDYGRFVQAWLNDGAGILKPATVQMALQDHLGQIKVPELLKSAMPDLSNDIPSLPVPQSWGLGFHLTLAWHAQQRDRRLGGRFQFLLLDRPFEGHRRRPDDAGAAFLRYARDRDTHGVRDGGVPTGGCGRPCGLTGGGCSPANRASPLRRYSGSSVPHQRSHQVK